MLQESILTLVITSIVAICGYMFKSCKHSECWSKKSCFECDTLRNSRSNSIITQPTIINSTIV